MNTSVSDSKLFHKIHKDPPFFTLWYNGVTLEIDIPIYLQTPFELDLHITHIITNTFNIYTIYYSQYIVNSNTAKHICSVPSKINNKKDLCLGCFYIVYNTESCIGSAKIAWGTLKDIYLNIVLNGIRTSKIVKNLYYKDIPKSRILLFGYTLKLKSTYPNDKRARNLFQNWQTVDISYG